MLLLKIIGYYIMIKTVYPEELISARGNTEVIEISTVATNYFQETSITNSDGRSESTSIEQPIFQENKVFTNRIGGSKSIDVSWLFPDREDLEKGILRINNETELEEVIRRLKKFAKDSLDQIAHAAAPHFLRTFYGINISADCVRGALQLFDGVRNLEEWALRMLDSNGFYRGGLFSLTWNVFGQYDECITVRRSLAGDTFRGQYCKLHIRPLLSPSSQWPSLSTWEVGVKSTELDHLMDIPISKWKRTLQAIYYRTAICVPSTCSKHDIQSVFDAVSRYTSILNITVQQCDVRKESVNIDTQMILWIILLGSAVIFVLISTFVHICIEYCKFRKKLPIGMKESGKKPTLLTIFLTFSTLSNAKKLMSKESSDGKLTFFHGMRFGSMAWVVLSHCYTNDPNLFGSQSEIGRSGGTLWFQSIANGYLAVDTFFFISGFLVAYLHIQKMEQQNGRFSYVAFYMQRFIRLTPCYLFVLGIYVLLPYLGNGPQWRDVMEFYGVDNCKRTWWINILYINNFFFRNDSCSTHFWYLSTLFQFFLLSPPILSALFWKPFLGISMLFFLTGACMALSGVLNFIWNLPPAILYRLYVKAELQYHHLYSYTMPYHHGPPYFLGMFLGYFLHRKGGMKVNRMISCLGWIASSAFCLIAIYGVYPWNRGDDVQQEWASIYAAFSRIAWSFGIAWVTFVCFTRNGGFVNALLSSKPMILLSKLSYCVYLIHMVFIILFRAHLRNVEEFSHLTIVYLFFAVMLLSHLSAIFCTLVSELPFQTLQKLVESLFNQRPMAELKIQNVKIESNESIQITQNAESDLSSRI